MLRSLHISHYVLIDSLDITFPEGLVIITGQTGAGKSILLGALSLLTGGKADAAAIREGEESCVVEAVFSMDDTSDDVKAILEENDIEWENGELIIRRVVHSSGRSRCFINDSPVNIQLLSGISGSLIDIHSQHKSLILTDPKFQLSALDFYAGTAGLCSECRELWKELSLTRKELAAAEDALKKLGDEKDCNDREFRELESAALKEGEIETLELEQKTLANAEEIKQALESALDIARPSGNEERAGFSQALREIRKNLEHAGRFVPSLESLCERVESARIELDDIADEIESSSEGIDVSEERLTQVEDRLSCLYALLRKHSCGTIGELIAERDRLSEALFEGYDLEEKIKGLSEKLKVQSGRHLEICSRLNGKRAEAAVSMGKEITSSLRYLELERAEFKVSVRPAAPGASGSDSAAFLFSANGGEPADISKCASGGELSRIMLSLKAMMARFVGMPAMIFDEIDSGVSGSVAAKMGSMICTMGRDMQVFAITHLPQVAAKGNAHFLVSKNFNPDSGLTTSGIRQINGEERVQELARMLSSETVTPEAIANARSLLV